MRRGSVHLDTIKKTTKKHWPKPLSKMFKENQVYYYTIRIKSGRAPIVFDMLMFFFLSSHNLL